MGERDKQQHNIENSNNTVISGDEDNFGLSGARPTKAKSAMTIVNEMRKITVCNKGNSLKICKENWFIGPH